MMNRRQVTYSSRPSHAARAAHARGDQLFRSYDTSAVAPKKSKVPRIIAIVLAIVLVGALAVFMVSFIKGCSDQRNLLQAGQTVEVVIPNGSGAQKIASLLKEAKLISDTGAFTKRVAALGADTSLKPGTYKFEGGTGTDELIAQLRQGPGLTGTPLTVPEGYTVKSLAERVAAVTNGKVTADDFIDAASDASVYAASFTFLEEAGENSLEGYLFPKTYYIDTTNATADSLIRLMLKQFQEEFATLDLTYPTEKGLSAYDVVKLASIVEKEATNSTRGAVASVFYNRLDIGMALQSDATTAYEVGEDPTYEQVHEDTPYSTYTHTGLPPTPICSPGLASLQAVCSPDETSYFYFYFRTEDGETKYYFSETNEEHNSAVFS